MGVGEGKGQWDKHRDYQGEGFISFVNNEVYYAIERAQKKGLVREMNQRTYEEIKERVLEGVVKKAVELFTEWGGTCPPDTFKTDESGKQIPPTDQRNLRVGLEQYVGF